MKVTAKDQLATWSAAQKVHIYATTYGTFEIHSMQIAFGICFLLLLSSPDILYFTLFLSFFHINRYAFATFRKSSLSIFHKFAMFFVVDFWKLKQLPLADRRSHRPPTYPFLLMKFLFCPFMMWKTVTNSKNRYAQ